MSRGWIHDLVLETPGQRVRDDEGRWKPLGNPTPFRGRIAYRSASRADVAGGRGEMDLVAVQIPNGLPVVKGSHIVAEGLTGRDAGLNGRWRIDAVAPNPKMQRAMCSRTSTP